MFGLRITVKRIFTSLIKDILVRHAIFLMFQFLIDKLVWIETITFWFGITIFSFYRKMKFASNKTSE